MSSVNPFQQAVAQAQYNSMPSMQRIASNLQLLNPGGAAQFQGIASMPQVAQASMWDANAQYASQFNMAGVNAINGPQDIMTQFLSFFERIFTMLSEQKTDVNQIKTDTTKSSSNLKDNNASATKDNYNPALSFGATLLLLDENKIGILTAIQNGTTTLEARQTELNRIKTARQDVLDSAHKNGVEPDEQGAYNYQLTSYRDSLATIQSQLNNPQYNTHEVQSRLSIMQETIDRYVSLGDQLSLN